MRKRILCVLFMLVFVYVIGFALWDCFLWRLFGFKYCETPEYLNTNLDVEDSNCYICLSSNCVGSFSSTMYNGIIYKFDNGILRIGIHKGFFGSASELCKEFSVDAPITEIRICGNGSEQIIFDKSSGDKGETRGQFSCLPAGCKQPKCNVRQGTVLCLDGAVVL